MAKLTMSLTEFATYKGVSRVTVHEWKNNGWIVMDGRKVDVHRTQEVLIEKHPNKGVVAPRADRVREAKEGSEEDPFAWLGVEPPKPRSQPAKKPDLQADPPTAMPDLDEERLPDETEEEFAARMLASGKAAMSYNDARKMRENYEALLKKIKYDAEIGALVPVSEVSRLVGEEYAKIRTRLLAIPAEQSPRLKRCKTVAEVQDVLSQIITDALEELSADVVP